MQEIGWGTHVARTLAFQPLPCALVRVAKAFLCSVQPVCLITFLYITSQ